MEISLKTQKQKKKNGKSVGETASEKSPKYDEIHWFDLVIINIVVAACVLLYMLIKLLLTDI